MFDNIIFDMDGTLLNTQKGIGICVHYALEQMKFPDIDEKDVSKFIGPSLYTSFSNVCSMTEQQAQDAITHFRYMYLNKGIYECEFYEGMEDVLVKLKKMGKKLSVASSKPKIAIDKLVEHFDTLKLFDIVVGPSFAVKGNGKEELIKNAIIGSHPIMVGDTEFDIKGAHDNNIPSIACEYGFGNKERLKEFNPTYYVKKPIDILKIIDNEVTL